MSISEGGGAESADGGARRIELMIADDTYLIREALEQIMRDSRVIDVVGTYGDRDTLLEAIDAAPPDAVHHRHPHAADRNRRGHPGRAGAARTHPRIGVVVLSQYAEPGYVRGAAGIRLPGRAYLLKERISAPASCVGGRDRRGRRLGGGPQGGGGAGPGANDRARARRSRPSARVSTRCSRNWPRARATPRSPRRSCSPKSGGEAHQLDLRQARASRSRGRQPPRDGGADVPLSGRAAPRSVIAG